MTNNTVKNIKMPDGQVLELQGGTSLPLFSPVIQDHVLSFDESMGYALQGTYVYKTGVAGERYGYPEFVERCFDEKTAGEAVELTVGETTITIYKNTNGHIYYDISDKAAIDSLFEIDGIADMYGIDEENERVFLPRNNWFMQLTTDTSKVNEYNEAGLPNIEGVVYNIACQNDTNDGAMGANGCFEAFVAGSRFSYGTSKSGSRPDSFRIDASNSSKLYGNSDTVQPTSSNKLLYYVVGNTKEITNVSTTVPETEVLSQVNKNTSDIAELDDEFSSTSHVIDTYQNGASWYRIWSDGWCEQGGGLVLGTAKAWVAVNLLKKYRNNYYSVIASNNGSASTNSYIVKVGNSDINTTNQVKLLCESASSGVTWRTAGYLAEGEY